LAFAGVVITLLLRQRQLRLQGTELSRTSAAHVRQLHIELQRMAIESDKLARVWGAEDVDAFKRNAYVNLILSDWEMQWTEGLLTENQVRTLLKKYFSLDPFRSFWQNSQEHRKAMAADDAGRRFHDMAERAWAGG